MRQTALFLVSSCFLAVLPACSLHQFSGSTARGKAADAPRLPAPEGYRAVLRPGTWALERISQERTVIWIRSAESGCNSFDHAQVSAVKGGLRVKAIDRVLIPKRGYGCLLPLNARQHRVQLPRLLGEGKIFGECAPGDDTPEKRICALLFTAAGR